MEDTRDDTRDGAEGVASEVGGRVLLRAEFDPRLMTYNLLVIAITLTACIVTIPLLLPWLLGVGRYITRRQFEALEAELTERSLNVRRGFLFRLQKNVPLDKITDLAVNEGPILRYLGLCTLGIETAGGGGNEGGMGQARLTGVRDALAFRDAVLRQRDRVTGGSPATADPAVGLAPGAGETATLTEIRDTLGRIEELLRQRG